MWKIRSAYYMYHELGGAKRDDNVIKHYLLRSGVWEKDARILYKEIFNEDFPEEEKAH